MHLSGACTHLRADVQAEQLLDQKPSDDEFTKQLRLALYIIASEYAKARQEAIEARQEATEARQEVKEAVQRGDRVAEARQEVRAGEVKEAVQRGDRVAEAARQEEEQAGGTEARQEVKEAVQRGDRVAEEARQEVKEAVQEVKEAVQRTFDEAREVQTLTGHLATAEARLYATETRLEKQTLDAAKDCSAMYARVIIEWFELSRRIGAPRQKAWSQYLQNNPEFNDRLQAACAKQFEGNWDVGVQKEWIKS